MARTIFVSVPIRGLFNLTNQCDDMYSCMSDSGVSVPIRGLFNLTLSLKQ